MNIKYSLSHKIDAFLIGFVALSGLCSFITAFYLQGVLFLLLGFEIWQRVRVERNVLIVTPACAELERQLKHDSRQWKPIATAPQDGTVIEVYCPGAEYELSDLFAYCAWHPDAGFCVCELRFPTHWREKPKPPTA